MVATVATGSCETISTVPPGRLSWSVEDAVLSFGAVVFFSLFLFLANAISSAVGAKTFIISKILINDPDLLMPEFVIKDVTDDDQYYNKNLVNHPYSRKLYKDTKLV